jgi:hypothetical protein
MQSLDVLDLESVQEEVVEPQHSDGIVETEAQHEGLQEVIGALDGSPVFSFLALPHIDGLLLHIHPNLQLHILDHSLAYLFPARLERSETVRRNHNRVHFECLLAFSADSSHLLF